VITSSAPTSTSLWKACKQVGPRDPRERTTGQNLRRLNARDIDTVLATMHPDVDWPNGMEGGRVYGVSAVRNYWERQWTLINPNVQPISFASDGTGRTVVTVQQVIRDLDGKILNDRVVRHVYTLRDGLITHMEIVETAEVQP